MRDSCERERGFMERGGGGVGWVCVCGGVEGEASDWGYKLPQGQWINKYTKLKAGDWHLWAYLKF